MDATSASQGKLKEFNGTTDFKGLRFNIDGVPALGDRFKIKISNNLSDLKLKVTDGEKLATSSFYSIEPVSIQVMQHLLFQSLRQVETTI